MNTKVNPANSKKPLPPNFRPMSGGQLRLQVPEREGYHRHWIRGTAERIQRAQQAGYTFVDRNDVNINNFDIAGDQEDSGNTDLGTRVSVASGDMDDRTGQPINLFLMECPIEFYEASRAADEAKVDQIAAALSGQNFGHGDSGETLEDKSNRYIKGKLPAIFTRKTNRRP